MVRNRKDEGPIGKTLRHRSWWGRRHFKPAAQTARLRHRCNAINNMVVEMIMGTNSQNAAEDDKSLSRITAYIAVVRQQWKRIENNVYFN